MQENQKFDSCNKKYRSQPFVPLYLQKGCSKNNVYVIQIIFLLSYANLAFYRFKTLALKKVLFYIGSCSKKWFYTDPHPPPQKKKQMKKVVDNPNSIFLHITYIFCRNSIRFMKCKPEMCFSAKSALSWHFLIF